MKILDKYNQSHLLAYKDQLTEEEIKKLENQIKSIDFDLIQSIFDNKDKVIDTKDNLVAPLVATKLNPQDKEHFFKKGLESIKEGEVAVVLMAGGQGTRLGHQGPKGTYDIGLPSHKSLFHLQADKFLSLRALSGFSVKWYVMTSEDNHRETVDHFESSNYFNYGKENIHFFKQDRLPLVLENGQIAMKSSHEINLAANGNGGVFSSLHSNGLLEEMQSNGVKYVYLYGVDNAIAKIADPVFVGFTIDSGLDVASKSVDKENPEEKVGVICYRDHHPDIVEYSELPEDMRYKLDDEGKLLYRNGNIVSHIFTLDFLMDCVDKEIPYHTAYKKVDTYSDNGLIKADNPNGYKFELFLFDVFKFTEDMAVLSVTREEEFTPVKNKEGADSPETARTMILKTHHKWLTEAGFNCNLGYEVNTSISYDGENLSNKTLENVTFK
ncbi:UDPGP type 1 family protein [Acidaminobacter sp. JC074]|uniref:UDPGP type 1 family protein n=1 Tax=Acidaminobacter sp. JC074 TaxID=2530199 RepID=UPI001F0F7FF9|nr:UDPGP type 1 family protein [Acidaminobacter sp. JC074]